MISKIKIYFLISFLSGCKSMDADAIYKKCVVDKTQQELTEGYGIEKNIFKLLEEAELSLLESKIIQNTSRENYLELTKMNFNDDEFSKKITSSIKTNVDDDFFNFLSLTTLDFYSSCPEQVYNNETNAVKKNILRKRFTIYANLMADGYKNKVNITSLINESEKFSETERLVVLHLILMNLSN